MIANTTFTGRSRRRVAGILTALFFLVFATGYAAQNHEQSVDPKFSKKAMAEVKRNQAQIARELSAGSLNEWWGNYYNGDGLGANVSFSMGPKNGFVFTWTGCVGLYDENYGDVVFENGRYKLRFHYPNKRDGFEGLAGEFIPVRWSSRHYLIEADKVVEFLNAVNSGSEASTKQFGHRFLLKREDANKAVSGFPDVPAEYKEYLLNSPIKAQITSIGESKNGDYGRLTKVVLNVGTADGVRPGMAFYVYEPRTIFETVKVTSLSEHSAEAALFQYGPHFENPSKDWQLSTYALTARD